MAKGLPTFSAVNLPKRREPFWLKRKLTTAWLFWSKLGCASVRSAPSTVARLEVCTQRFCSGLSFNGNASHSWGGFWLAPVGCSWHKSWKVNFAVRPSTSRISFELLRPGIWMAIRSLPCCWIVGSVVPKPLSRFSTIFSDWAMADATFESKPRSEKFRLWRSSWLLYSKRLPATPDDNNPLLNGCNSFASAVLTLSASAKLERRIDTPFSVCMMPL
jgi:hypothetical protein